MTIFQRNRAKGRAFKPNVLCFGFSMARLATFVMQIV
jgi:hypothetical protein